MHTREQIVEWLEHFKSYSEMIEFWYHHPNMIHHHALVEDHEILPACTDPRFQARHAYNYDHVQCMEREVFHSAALGKALKDFKNIFTPQWELIYSEEYFKDRKVSPR